MVFTFDFMDTPSIQCNSSIQNFIMSRQMQTQRIRATSARPLSATFHRPRPSSGHLNQGQRQDLIQNTYSPASSRNRPQTAKTLIHQLPTFHQDEKQKKAKIKQFKPKEVMAEEILNLKLKVNGLAKELGHQRGKTEQLRKKNNRFAKVLNVQFQNQRLWNAKIVDSHRVEGMRNMYDKLKEAYENLSKDHEQLQKNMKITKELEYLHYIDSLETQLKNINQRFQKIAQNSLQLLSHENNYENQARLYLMGETEHDHQQLLERYSKLKAKQQMTIQSLKDRNRKIEFMDRYSKDLENRVRDLQRKIEKGAKQVKKTKEQLAQMTILNQTTKKCLQQEIDVLNSKISEMKLHFESEKSALSNQKDEKIKHLLKENTYYQQMIKELRTTNNEISQEIQSLKNSRNNQKITKKITETFISKQTPEHNDHLHEMVQVVGDCAKQIDAGGKRVRRTADKKFRERAVKKRKVEYREVIQIQELLRLKVIGQNVSIDKVVGLLTYSNDPELSEAENTWNREYISMREIKTILKKQPFWLNQDQSDILSRFITEDIEKQFVYVDEDNENYRQMVKSIFKNMLNQYPLLQKNPQLDKELKIFFQRYGPNLFSMLKSIEPSGLISIKRFKDTLRSIGAQYSDDLVDVLLGRMSLKASTIKELDYKTVFSENCQ